MQRFHTIPLVTAYLAFVSIDLPASEPSPGRDAVRTALTAVDRWLAHTPHAPAWHERLATRELRHEVEREGTPDPAMLEGWLRQLTAGGPMPVYAPVVGLRRSVEGWLALESLPDGRHLPAVAMSILQSPATRGGTSRAELRKQLIALTAMLSRYDEQRSDDLAQSIDGTLRRLTAAEEAKGLVDAVRHYYGHPNVWIDISEDLLDDPVDRMIERIEGVSDIILGTPVSGNSRVRAKSDLLIEPAADRAILKIVVEGHVDAQTTGRRGPAQIDSRSTTRFRAEKQLLIEPTGLKVLPTVCRAQLAAGSSKVSATTGGLRGRIVRGVAERRWEASRDAALREGQQHVEQRVCAAVDREADALIRRLDRLVVRPVLALRNQGTPVVQFNTEKGILRIGVRRGPLGAPIERPPVEEGRLFVVRVHSSLIGRAGGNGLADLTAPLRLEKLATFTPAGIADTVQRALTHPAQLFPASFHASPLNLSALAGDRLWQRLAWRWLDQTVSPRLGVNGIVLRDGRWGTVTPGGIGGDWPLLAWRPPALPEADDADLPDWIVGSLR
jgi:hypothetical protein